MRNIKCSDCEEYRNEWCEKIIDSPYPDMLRDCQYWHERKDMVEVVRCMDCRHLLLTGGNESTGEGIYTCDVWKRRTFNGTGFCSYAERRSDEQDD